MNSNFHFFILEIRSLDVLNEIICWMSEPTKSLSNSLILAIKFREKIQIFFPIGP